MSPGLSLARNAGWVSRCPPITLFPASPGSGVPETCPGPKAMAAPSAGQHVALDAEARHSQPGNGPGIGPRPGLCLALAAQGPCPGVRDETLRQPRLGLNPCFTPQLPRA